MHLRSGFIVDTPLDRRLILWLSSLEVLLAFNIALWVWIAATVGMRTPYATAQLLLSSVYVSVCGFRSLFPRVDLVR